MTNRQHIVDALTAERFGLHVRESEHDDVFDDCDTQTARRRRELREALRGWHPRQEAA